MTWHTTAVLNSWDDLIDQFGARPGMWVGRPKFALVRSFVVGFGEGRGDDLLQGFQEWLSSQPQHQLRSNYAWWNLILDELFPDRRQEYISPWDRSDHPEWPTPPSAPISENDLVYPEEDKLAINYFFLRLQEYRAIRN